MKARIHNSVSIYFLGGDRSGPLVAYRPFRELLGHLVPLVLTDTARSIPAVKRLVLVSAVRLDNIS